MSEALMVLKGISLARTLISEGLSAIESHKEYIRLSQTLSEADKQTLMDEINKTAETVKNSKFNI